MTEPCTFGDHDFAALADGRHEPILLYRDVVDEAAETGQPMVYYDGRGERCTMDLTVAKAAQVNAREISDVFGVNEAGLLWSGGGYLDALREARWEQHRLLERVKAVYADFQHRLDALHTMPGKTPKELAAIREGILNMARGVGA
jgi:hypothetical protein